MMRKLYNETFDQLDVGAVFKFKDWEDKKDDVFMKIVREVPGDGKENTACVCIYSGKNNRMGRVEYPADSVKIVECSWQIRYNEDKQGEDKVEEQSENKTVEDVFKSFLNEDDSSTIDAIKEIIK
jgi:hypothetical protein